MRVMQQKAIMRNMDLNKNIEPGGNASNEKAKNTSWKEFFTLGEVGGYFFRKKDPSRPSNINIKMMHGINRISIIIFILGIIFLILKRFL
jgi:hypothetical protein